MAEVKETKITIVTGAGVKPITIETTIPIKLSEVLERAGVTLGKGETPVVGETMIENLDEMIHPGQMVVIDSMPSNG